MPSLRGVRKHPSFSDTGFFVMRLVHCYGNGTNCTTCEKTVSNLDLLCESLCQCAELYQPCLFEVVS